MNEAKVSFWSPLRKELRQPCNLGLSYWVEVSSDGGSGDHVVTQQAMEVGKSHSE
jgi:hypothetical protein